MKINDFEIDSEEIIPLKYMTIDTETTGVVGRYPYQDFAAIDVLQIGAITSDANFKTLKEYELFSSLSDDINIAPEALLTHGLFKCLDKDESAMDMFKKFQLIIEKEMSEEPIALLSYKGASYDLPLLQHQLYKNLLNPYPLQTLSATSIDVQQSVVLALALSSEMPRVFNKNGNIVTQLSVVADSLGISTNRAHDAVADCKMTVGILKTFRESFPIVNALSSICGNKDKLYDLLGAGAVLSELDYMHFRSKDGRGPISNQPLLALGRDGNSALCVDLSAKTSDILSLSDQEISDNFGFSSAAIFRIVKLNKCPAVSPLGCHDLKDFNLDSVRTYEKINEIKDNYEFLGKIKRIWKERKSNFQSIDRPENQIYSGFASERDKSLMGEFYAAKNPADKKKIISHFEDEKYIDLGERILNLYFNIGDEYSSSICDRLTENFNRTSDYPTGLTNKSSLIRTRELLVSGEFKGEKIIPEDIKGLQKLEEFLVKRENFIAKNSGGSNDK